MRKNTEKTPGT